ncbi:IclR family transcriptional regulator [Nocardioides flavus (ex Wang et al. 2016)]|uniref:IclR family transcriptional regulator n=1 Tax=Nocardioides flavus (ex Wang et al. 2016) TaxID=2058780 RepID=A0ABQ3HFX4_9ACTN|nr:IclR family transcriptional regulator [Nocardioides flavus (ex Wang et al. 2016)]GHE16466.1 IclR family transcriptional regulator [Nocardioides flavus (ex Wang et al. 2016)]
MSETATGTRALDRAADLVATVVHADEPMSFADLQDASGLAKSTTSRLLTALERSGLLERDPSGSYVAGRLFWLYAARHDPWEELVRLARPVMDALGADTGETVHLSVARGERVVQVAQVDSTFLLGTRDWTDVEVPAHCSALGKVLLAWGALELPEGDLERPTPSTLPDADAVRRDCEQARRRGWALTQDELEIGLTGIAVPVFGVRDDVVASLGISGPTPRLAQRADELGRRLLDRSAALSSLLRGPARPTTVGGTARTENEEVVA